MLGGRTNHWGRISLRFGPKILKQDYDGLGETGLLVMKYKTYYDN